MNVTCILLRPGILSKTLTASDAPVLGVTSAIAGLNTRMMHCSTAGFSPSCGIIVGIFAPSEREWGGRGGANVNSSIPRFPRVE